ncbi:MAG: hypothetical protein JW731_12170 [Bacteroidales bacterium]|nr:hypothetical protein [Bacteroidales bacterium]
MKYLSCLIAIVFLLISLTSVGQNIPRKAEEIPLFPGSVTDMEKQQQALKDYQEIFAGEQLSDLRVSVYKVKTIPDDVCRFYIEKLNAGEGFPDDDYDSPHPDKNIKPWYEVSYFDNSWFKDQYEGNIKIQDGKWIKAALSEREQWIQGKWLQGAYFEWTVTLENGDWSRHFVDIIDDNSFDSRAKTVNNKTIITIVSQIGTSDDEIDDD